MIKPSHSYYYSHPYHLWELSEDDIFLGCVILIFKLPKDGGSYSMIGYHQIECTGHDDDDDSSRSNIVKYYNVSLLLPWSIKILTFLLLLLIC